MDRKTDEEQQARERADRREGWKREWTELPDLPEPTYDPRNGWKLDQFAMHFEPDLLREYKRLSFGLYHPKLRTNPFDHAALLLLDLELVIHKRLLEPAFQVKGFRPNAYEAEVVPTALLEKMYPIIETSELLDTTHWPEIARRRYEHVRVFEPARKSPGGRPPTYDWPG
jgi:hypothetical protein